MAAGFLIDTNIFLEILLEQDRWKLCERTLEEHLGDSAMTDFAFHSIAVAEHYGLSITTLDQHFHGIHSSSNILLLR